MFKNQTISLFLILCVCHTCIVLAQNKTIDTLPTVKLKADKHIIKPVKTNIQILNFEKIEASGSMDIGDLLKQFSGVNIKDYGGLGGIKTISVRGLGTTHTKVSYDGVVINSSQSGQIDLGKFSTDNIEAISLSIGSPESIFLPARNFSSASMINIVTKKPFFDDNDKFNAKAKVKTGSFGLISPSIIIEYKLSDNISISAYQAYTSLDGDFPIILYNGVETAEKIRKNSDLESYNTEISVFYDNDKTKIFGKYYSYSSERGLPGFTDFYDHTSYDRLWDDKQYWQLSLESELSSKFSIKINTKYSKDYLRYLDKYFFNGKGKDDVYNQDELYFSSSLLYKYYENTSFSISSDYFRNTMDSNKSDFPFPTRNSFLTAISMTKNINKFSMQATLLHIVVLESVEIGEPAKNIKRYNPSLSLSYDIKGDGNLLLKTFYKEIFRNPSFNDLYYTEIGSRVLDPEDSKQYGLGISWYVKKPSRDISFINNLEFFHNKVFNKIVALPRGNITSMVNKGEVEIFGFDLNTRVKLNLENNSITFSGTYMFQSVADIDKESSTYGHQLEYTPVNSGSMRLEYKNDWFTSVFSSVFSGHTYSVKQNIDDNKINRYNDSSLSFIKDFKFKHIKGKLKLDILNVFDKSYEIIKNYPMPGRNYRLSLQIKI